MNKEELLKKVKALVDFGVGGEKENAEKIFEKLIEKYDINDLNFLDDEPIKHFSIRYYHKWQIKILSQVVYKILGDRKAGNFGGYRYGIKECWMNCKKSEFIEIEMLYNFYCTHFEKDLELFIESFIYENKIFPSSDKIKLTDEDMEITEEEKNRLRKINLMRMGLEEHKIVREIDYKGDNN